MVQDIDRSDKPSPESKLLNTSIRKNSKISIKPMSSEIQNNGHHESPLSNGAFDIVEATLFSTSKMFMSNTTNHNKITLEFHDLCYTVPDPLAAKNYVLSSPDSRPMKTVISEVSGAFKPGELTAIMGPSGSGKTTLMSILAGYKTTNVEGQILVNGKPRNLSSFRKLSCYIMQDDVLLQQLTVIEAMSFAAQLKLPLRSTKIHKLTRISQILDTIGLAACTQTKTCNLSGGERKRLAIALELITNPPVMFFDEPTSGLDSSSCYSCVTLLKSLAHNGGRTIIATIHQPSARIFEQFDSLYLLADGNCCYEGATRTLVPFFASQGLLCPLNYNPASFAIEVATGEYGKHWVDLLRKVNKDQHLTDSSSSSSSLTCNNNSPSSPSNHKTSSNNNGQINVEGQIDPEQKKYKLYYRVSQNFKKVRFNGYDDNGVDSDTDKDLAKFCNQFRVLLKRSFLCISRDMLLNHLRFVFTIAVGLLLGLICRGYGESAENALNNIGGLFFGMLFLIFSAMLTTILTFPLEREVLLREHMNYWYSLKPYYLARTLADLPFQIFFPILFVIITYFMSNQPPEAYRFGIVCLMSVLISLVCQSIGMLVGAICSIEATVFIAPISSIPFVLFNGVFTKLSTVPLYLRWFAYCSYVRFALQGIILALYGFDREELSCEQPYCLFKDPKVILSHCEALDVSIVQHASFTFLILIGIRIMTYFALRYKIASEK